MMKDFVLIQAWSNDMEMNIQYFDTLDEAQEAMFNDVDENIDNALDLGLNPRFETLNGDFGITTTVLYFDYKDTTKYTKYIIGCNMM